MMVTFEQALNKTIELKEQYCDPRTKCNGCEMIQNGTCMLAAYSEYVMSFKEENTIKDTLYKIMLKYYS